MTFERIVQSHTFVFLTGLVGGGLAVLLKALVDFWTGEKKRREDLRTTFIKRIEQIAPDYYLMSNHASLLSIHLATFVRDRRDLQMQLIDQNDRDLFRGHLKNRIEKTAAAALFEAGKLYRTITQTMLVKGGDLLVPDLWARKALIDLHNEVVKLLRFDDNVLLKYIGSKADRQSFESDLQKSKTDPAAADLKEAYATYRGWLFRQDNEVKRLAVNARAYSKLFSLQLERLYKDGWDRSVADPMQARDVVGESRALQNGTRAMIRVAAEQDARLEAKESRLAEEVLDRSRSMSNALLSAGWSYYVENKYDIAIESFQHATQADEKNPDAFNCLANAHTGAGDFVKAESSYNEARKLDAGEPFFDLNLGRMLAKANRFEEALTAFATALDKVKGLAGSDELLSTLHNDRGVALMNLARFNEAITSFRNAVALQPLNAVLYSNMADAYKERGKAIGGDASVPTQTLEFMQKAALAYQTAANLDSPACAAAHYLNAADVFRDLRSWPDTLKACRSALESEPPAADRVRSLTLIGIVHEVQLDRRRAAEAYAEAMVVEGIDARSAVDLLKSLRRCGDDRSEFRDRALAVCRNAVEIDRANRERRSDLAELYFSSGDFPHFLEERDAILKLVRNSDPLDPEELASCYNQLGLAYRKNGVPGMALDYYRRAIQTHSTLDYNRNLGLFLQSQGRYEEAMPALERATAPGCTPDYHICLGLADVRVKRPKQTVEQTAEDYAQAVRLCDAATRLQPMEADPHLLRALCLSRQGRFEDAAQAYRAGADLLVDAAARALPLRSALVAYDNAIEAEPHRVQLRLGRARTLVALGDIDAAKTALNDALGVADGDALDAAIIEDEQALLFYRTSQNVTNPTHIADALAAAKQTWERVYNKGNALLSAGGADALKGRLGTLDLDRVTNNLGTVYDALNEKDAARARYFEVVLKRPQTLAAQYNLARSEYYAAEFANALSHFQEAMRLPHPDSLSAAISLNIGNCCFRLGWMDIGERQWKDVLGCDSRHSKALALYNLGVLAARQGVDDEAQEYWRRATAVAPDLLNARFNLAVMELKRGEREIAIRELKSLQSFGTFEFLGNAIAALEASAADAPVLSIRDIEGQ